MKFERLSLPGGVGRPKGSAGPTWAPLALNFLSRFRGHEVAPCRWFWIYFAAEEFDICQILLDL